MPKVNLKLEKRHYMILRNHLEELSAMFATKRPVDYKFNQAFCQHYAFVFYKKFVAIEGCQDKKATISLVVHDAITLKNILAFYETDQVYTQNLFIQIVQNLDAATV